MGVLTRGTSYQDIYDSFTWPVPDRFNMAWAVCDRHAATTPDHPALIVDNEGDDEVLVYSFLDIQKLANRFANVLVSQGLKPGDRVSILLSQSIEAAVAHVAAWKCGLISIPLFNLFGEEALEFRLSNSTTRALVTDQANLSKITAIRPRVPTLEQVYLVDGTAEGEGLLDFWQHMDQAPEAFQTLDTDANDPGFIIYTSGTTGNPKGALHAHRALIGHMPCIEMFHEFPDPATDVVWTPADWAWIGGLMNTLMGAWFNGITVLAHRARKYAPEKALRLMEKHRVTNVFMPPTALKIMRDVPAIKDRFDLNLRTVAVAGETMGVELLEWGRENLGLTLNEFYGQTECNIVVSNCAGIMPARPGSMGRAVPGHQVGIVDDTGRELPTGEVGTIAVKSPDPVMLLEYWDNRAAYEAKIVNGWWLMGDQAHMDEDGYIFFKGRDDDLITSAGYRIGPSEIEDCLTRHPSVALAAVVGVPDPVRTEIIKAFIVLREGENLHDGLEDDLREFVKTRLSPHEYPRLFEFRDSLPMTTTGKIQRKVLREANPEVA